jgi:hypothetical protein
VRTANISNVILISNSAGVTGCFRPATGGTRFECCFAQIRERGFVLANPEIKGDSQCTHCKI